MRIFTVGIGSGEGSLIPLRTDDGGTDFVRDTDGKPVQSKLDEKRLREIAEAGGGFYEPLGADAARIIFEKGILPIEQADTGILSTRQPIERYQWPLGLAVGLLGLWLILGDRKRAPLSLGKGTAALVLLGLSVSAASAATGLEEYQAGDFEKAKAEFEKRLQAAPDSDKLHFNAGAASYKLGDFAKAVDHFTKSLLTEDPNLREDSSYNLANALVRRGEAAKGNEEKKADWKNAIQHYSETLKLDPKNKQAEENREIVKKMLDDLEKQEEQQKQDQQQQQKQDQQQQQKQDQQQQQKQDQQQQQKQDQQQQQKQDQQQQKQDQQNSRSRTSSSRSRTSSSRSRTSSSRSRTSSNKSRTSSNKSRTSSKLTTSRSKTRPAEIKELSRTSKIKINPRRIARTRRTRRTAIGRMSRNRKWRRIESRALSRNRSPRLSRHLRRRRRAT